MNKLKSAAVAAAAVSMAAGILAFAPAASADNYAPQLPSNRVDAGSRETLTFGGAQPGCRVTFTIENRAGREVRGPWRTGVNAAGEVKGSIRMPKRPGVYSLITRVDNFPGKTGCTPTKSIQRIVVQ